MAESIPKRRGGSRFGGILVTQDMSEDILSKGSRRGEPIPIERDGFDVEDWDS